MGMILTDEQQAILDGAKGETMAKVMKTLVMFGEAFHAEKMVPGMVYCVPWDIWKTMKDHFGRKYVTEADLEKYQVQTAWNGTLLLLN